MLFKRTHNLISLIFWSVCLIALFSSFVLSQTPEQDKKKIKDFGKSLTKKNEKEQSPGGETIEEQPEDEDLIKVETNLVRTDVLVLDQQGKMVSGLKSEDFIISENNIPQEIGTFSLGDTTEVPRSIVLIIDYSGSQLPYIQTSVNAAKILVDNLNPKDKMAIVTDDVELLVPFSRDHKYLKEKLDVLAKKARKQDVGKSMQYSALMATLNEMFDSEDVRPIVIFQTDGDEAFGIKRDGEQTSNNSPYRTTTFTVKELFSTIEKSRATIYSVISGFSLLGLTPEERGNKTQQLLYPRFMSYGSKNALSIDIQQTAERLFRQQTSMVIVARESGGFTERLETPEQANEIYPRILNEINNRYLMGYYPSNSERDGKRRNVKIEVRGHPEYVVWGRKFYFAPLDKKIKGN